jgi:hypothetical protein
MAGSVAGVIDIATWEGSRSMPNRAFARAAHLFTLPSQE